MPEHYLFDYVTEKLSLKEQGVKTVEKSEILEIQPKRRLLFKFEVGQGGFNSSNTSTCGNGVLQGNETCDDNNTNQNDGCNSTCSLQTCGDGIINNKGSEECDFGVNNGLSSGCVSCKLLCGNGVFDQGEDCDDGNRNDGDGCNSTCKSQPAAAVLPVALGIPIAVVSIAVIVSAQVGATLGGAVAGVASQAAMFGVQGAATGGQAIAGQIGAIIPKGESAYGLIV